MSGKEWCANAVCQSTRSKITLAAAATQLAKRDAEGEFEPALFPIDEELRLPDTDYTVAFWFKTTAADVRLCEAKRYSSYNGRWSDHIVTTVGTGGQRLHVDGRLIATGKLTQRTKTSNRLGLDLGPGSGDATVTIDEFQIFGCNLPPSEIVRHSD